MPQAMIAILIVAGAMLYLGLLTWFLRWVISRSWKKLAGGREKIEAFINPGPDAVWKKYQSFSVGLSNFGGSIHVAVDEHYLYLVPAVFIRILGTYPISVPWTEITDVRPTGFSSNRMRVKINGVSVVGPAWCLRLADPDKAAPKR